MSNRNIAVPLATATASVIWLGTAVALFAIGSIDVGALLVLIGMWALGCLGLAILRYARRAARADGLHDEIADLAGRVSADASRLESVLQQLEIAGQRQDGRIYDAVADVHASVKRFQDVQLPALRRHITNAGINDSEQVMAWTELREVLGVTQPMPPLRGWAASPDILRIVVNRLLRDRPALVVECGSGTSSVWLGLAVRKVGGRLVSLEHDAEFAARSRELVASYGLDDTVEVRHAPLVEYRRTPQSEPQPWYDLRMTDDLREVGLLFVDGPPAATAPDARYPALPAFLDAGSQDLVVILDDADRPDERSTVERWLEEFDGFSARRPPAEKGAVVLERVRGSDPA
ncbi:class I SAM-dependent methyltransferase [Agromyces allii]|uniref:class I SAM-dependent methyltransferase n=1 Tax=Agromyces allii TaxID=393607 RepID=UPI0014786131|nr:class I SAM-dependent methyltransferase [Agromyces allii]